MQGLKDWKPEDRPPVAIPFFAFRIMVGVGVAMLALVVCSWWVWRKGSSADARWFLKLCELASPLGFVAVVAGWVDDRSRPPALGRVRPDANARRASRLRSAAADVVVSLAVYVVAYVVIFGAGGYFLARLLRAGPVDKRAGDVARSRRAHPRDHSRAAAEGE